MIALAVVLIRSTIAPAGPIACQPTQATNEKSASALVQQVESDSARLKSLSAIAVNRTSRAQRQELVTVAQRRLANLQQLAETNPETAIAQLLDETDQVAVNARSTHCTETPITLTGDLALFAVDRPNAQEDDVLLLSTPGGGYHVTLPSGLRPDVHQATHVIISGQKISDLVLGTTIDTGSGEVVTANQPSRIPADEPPSGSVVGQPVLVLPTNFSDHTSSSPTPSTIQSNIMPIVSNYYQENSYGAFNLPATVKNWQTISMATTCDTNLLLSQYNSFWTKALDQARALDPNLHVADFKHLVLVSYFPCLSGNFVWSGLASFTLLPYTENNSTVYLSVALVNNYNPSYPGIGTFTHEIGHGYYLGHANFFNCADISQSCPFVEYGDYYDIMGDNLIQGSSPRHFNAMHKESTGFFLSGNLVTIAAPGTVTYDLEPIETASTNVKAIKIGRGPSPESLYIEYRQPIGVDTGMSGDVYAGALLHASVSISYEPSKSGLIDTTPSAISNTTASLPTTTDNCGTTGTYRDPLNGTIVCNRGVVNGKLRVQVTPGTLDLQPPQVTLTAPTNGQSYHNSVPLSVTASDDLGLAGITYYETPVGSTARTYITSVTTSPYSASWNTRNVTSGQYLVWAVATDKAGKSTASAQVTITVQ